MSEMRTIAPDALLFFSGRPGALPLYLAFDGQVRQRFPSVQVKVQKTQISYYDRRLFACVSLLPVRRGEGRPRDYITVTFGLDRRAQSPRVDAVSQVSPHRWTHHVAVASVGEIDGELMAWVAESAALAERNKRKA